MKTDALAPREPAACGSDHCITCSDEGVPMRVLHADTAVGLALCEDEQGRRSEVMTALVGPVSTGDLLLVHAGTALIRIEETNA